MSFWNVISYSYAPGNVIAGSFISSIFSYTEDPPYLHCFPNDYPDFSLPPIVGKSSPFSTSLSTFVIYWTLVYIHYN